MGEFLLLVREVTTAPVMNITGKGDRDLEEVRKFLVESLTTPTSLGYPYAHQPETRLPTHVGGCLA